jgi:hypothetical protein
MAGESQELKSEDIEGAESARVTVKQQISLKVRV